MDWFEMLTGFREAGYDDTRVKLKLEGGQLKSLVNGKSYRIGELELVSAVARLRQLNPALSVSTLKDVLGRVTAAPAREHLSQ